MPRTDLAVLSIETAYLPIEVDDWADVGADATSITRGGWGIGTKKRVGSSACNNNTKTNEIEVTRRMPNRLTTVSSIDTGRGEATTDANLILKVPARLTGTPATSAQLDLEARIDDKNAGVGSDICTTSAQNMLSAGAGTWTTYEFTISGAGGIAENAPLNMRIRAVLNDTGGSGGGVIEIGPCTLEVPVRGG